mmetsp:Transcript_4020/g.11234  ORF Transcript_4020/g.11234 Transcript_4020/m.11234 type:complete len:200 (-) Transcript_4020:40-639(-)|eukprot:CAMPEP_0119119606 /NCGR_PEP_ID=MMETSP1310-20130426/1024_1 /TAXON_ID=464262 /ORGANISM="Genus nov. species nov., Strain RCC2339" /LENGTH=199 /DNA_ID=CAMNT_0007109051 /DNA_START=132 /DNA_END=731 /DNA_ORIENTATION=+
MEEDAGKLLKAVHFAAEKHRDQRRKGDDSPYINHPIGVAEYVRTVGGVSDVNVLVAAVLHDTVEDTDTTLEEVAERFGDAIAKIVQEVTDDKNLSKYERKQGQIDHAGSISKEAKTVKLADKLYNLTDLLRVPPKGWSEERILGYFAWASAVIDQMRQVNPGLESEVDKTLATKLGTYSDQEKAKLLEDYLQSMRKVDD